LAVALALSTVLAGCNQRVAAGPRSDPEAALKLREKLRAAAPKGAGKVEDAASEAATGWATLAGRFSLVGSPPPVTKIRVDKDIEVCGKHNLVDESVVVGSDGALQNAVLFLRTARPQVHPDYQASNAAKVVFDNHDCRFEPHVQLLRVTQTLLVKNSDPVGHNTNFSAANNGAPNSSVPAAEAREQKFPKPEPLPVKVGCNIHPWMGGWLIVRSDPYAAVADKQGRFSIANLPAGKELEFQLWHEKVSFLKGAQIAGVKVDGKGRFKVKLKPNEPLELEIKVPAEVLQ